MVGAGEADDAFGCATKRRGRYRRGAMVLLLPALVIACAQTTEWFAGEERPTRVAQTDLAVAQGDSAEFPNLATVPDTRPAVTPPGMRARVSRALSADRAAAEFTGQRPSGTANGERAERMEPAAVIHFAHGSADLSAADRNVLRGIAARHRAHGGIVRVIGHANAQADINGVVGHRLPDMEASLERADAVAAELILLGVPEDRIRTEARGEPESVYHESMASGEAESGGAEIFLEY